MRRTPGVGIAVGVGALLALPALLGLCDPLRGDRAANRRPATDVQALPAVRTVEAPQGDLAFDVPLELR